MKTTLKKIEIESTEDTYKILNLTHNDLDGVSTDILLKSVFQDHDVKVVAKYLSYSNLSTYLKEHEEIIKKFDIILVTDLCVKKNNIEILAELEKHKENVVFLDHHLDSEHLSEQDNFYIEISTEKGKSSATSILADYLEWCGFKLNDNEKEYVNLVRIYDTWEWKEIYKDKELFYLNECFHLLGASRFKSKMLKQGLSITKEDLSNEDIMEKIYLTYFKEKVNRLKKVQLKINNKEMTVGIVAVDKYISTLGNKLLLHFKDEIDMVLLYNFDGKSVSYRSLSDDFKCNEFANLHGGGGHVRASGSDLTVDLIQLYFK